jgi:hypothetical protein
MSDSLVCSVELDKKKGITVRVYNEKQKLTQTVILNGETIIIQNQGDEKSSTITQKQDSVVTEVKGQEQTSIITQQADSVVVKCKRFQVEAETVSVKSTQDTTHESGGVLTVTSQKDLSLESSAKGTLKSTGALTLETNDKLNAGATQNVSISGLNTELKASTQVKVSGGTAVEVTGVKVDIGAQGQLTLEGAVTTLGKNLTTVKGQLVKVEGALVKLG